MRPKAQGMTRFERGLRDLHGDDFDVIDADYTDKPARSPWVQPTRLERARAWWKRQPHLEKVWLIWLWSICAMIGGFVGFVVMVVGLTL